MFEALALGGDALLVDFDAYGTWNQPGSSVEVDLKAILTF